MIRCFVLVGALLGQDVAADLRRAPTPAERAAWSEKGWPTAAQELESHLVAAYQPGGAGRPGSTGVTAFRGWMTLWKWADVLARSERDEAMRFLIDRIRWVPDEDRPIVFPSGFAPAADFPPLTPDQIARLAGDEAGVARQLEAILPPDLLPPGSGRVVDALDPKVVAEWINDDALSLALFDNLSDLDYLPGVLRRLQEIWLADPKKAREYRNLAVALAIVYDARSPAFWPHHQVGPSLVPRDTATVAERFRRWVAANEARGLLVDLRTLRVDQVKFVVDAPIEESEFEWARKNVRMNRSSFAKAFNEVNYASGRLRSQEYDWQIDAYTLENIRRRGGICVDQAYFAMVAGKAKGLPTLFFVGQGLDGGHAWFGYLKGQNRWQLDCGRYENQNYAIGEALDPQIWMPISDHELAFLADNFRGKLDLVASEDDMRMGALLEKAGEADRARRAYDSAVSVCPKNDRAWRAKGEYLRRSGASLDARRVHHEAAVKQFGTDRDIRVVHQIALAEIARAQGDVATAEALEKRIVSQNKRRRSDLSVGIVARQLQALVESGDYDAAFNAYRKQMSRIGKSGGGNLFYDVVRPFVEDLLDAGQGAKARSALAMARKELAPERGSILDVDLEKLAEKISASGVR